VLADSPFFHVKGDVSGMAENCPSDRGLSGPLCAQWPSRCALNGPSFMDKKMDRGL
jgi:hypothetical protein